MAIPQHSTWARCVVLVAVLVANAQGAQAGDPLACVSEFAGKNNFSGVVSVQEQAGAGWTFAFGRQAGPESKQNSEETRFNIGSAGKMFTAVAIGQLVDADKIRFDDRVGRFVSGLAPETDAVTIGQLLSHTSGLGDFFRPENFQALQQARSAADLLPLIVSEKPSFAPGSQFRYSNSAFALLGIVVERVSGESYADYLERHIFAPAVMTSTGLDPRIDANVAVGMTSRQIGARPSDTVANALPDATPLRAAPGALAFGNPAGGAFSTGADLHKFFAALLQHRLTTAMTADELISPKGAGTADPSGRDYGYGFGLRNAAGRRWLGHNGGTLGANAEAFATPGNELSLVVLANRDPPAATLMFGFVASLLGDNTDLAACRSSG